MVLGVANRAKADELARRQEEAEALWSDWLSDIGGDIAGALESLTELGQAMAKALDKLDTVSETKDGYQRSWNELLGDAKDTAEVGLRFKMGGVPGGEWGSIGDGLAVPATLNPITIVLAVLGEVIAGRSPSHMTGADRQWWEKLRQVPLGHQLRFLRELAESLSTSED